MEMFVNCPKCKKEISDKVNICPYCGSNLYNEAKYDIKKIIICVIGIILAVTLSLVIYDTCTISPDEAYEQANEAYEESKKSLQRTEDELQRAKNRLYDLYGY